MLLAHQYRQEATRSTLVALDRHPALNFLRLGIGENFIDQANRLAAFRRHPLLATFQLVEFLQHRHGDRDMVFLKVQQGIRVVN